MKTKWITALVLALLAVARPALGQTTWLVSNDPSENPDFATLADAVASPTVVNGDTILLSEGLGPYQGGVLVDKALAFTAEPGEDPVIYPDGFGVPDYGFRVDYGDPGIEVRGITFDGRNMPSSNGIIVYGLGITTVHDCTFLRLNGGVRTPRLAANCTFVDCVVAGSAIQFEDCSFSFSGPDQGGVYGRLVLRCSITGWVDRISSGGDDAEVRFQDCRFTDITIAPGGVGFRSGSFDSVFLFDNCLFANISASEPLITLNFSSATFRSCTRARCATSTSSPATGCCSSPRTASPPSTW